jgi:hypothetical protein
MRALKDTPEQNQNRLLSGYLHAQREELLSYLSILKHLADAVAGGDTERIQHYINLEKASVLRLEKLRLASEAAGPDTSLAELRASLSALTREALSLNAAVRAALSTGMEDLRRRIRTRPGGRKRGSTYLPSPYAGLADPSLVDLHT